MARNGAAELLSEVANLEMACATDDINFLDFMEATYT